MLGELITYSFLSLQEFGGYCVCSQRPSGWVGQGLPGPEDCFRKWASGHQSTAVSTQAPGIQRWPLGTWCNHCLTKTLAPRTWRWEELSLGKVQYRRRGRELRTCREIKYRELFCTLRGEDATLCWKGQSGGLWNTVLDSFEGQVVKHWLNIYVSSVYTRMDFVNKVKYMKINHSFRFYRWMANDSQ